jgi:hypothetical protein
VAPRSHSLPEFRVSVSRSGWVPYIRSSWGFGSIQPDQGSCVLEEMVVMSMVIEEWRRGCGEVCEALAEGDKVVMKVSLVS